MTKINPLILNIKNSAPQKKEDSLTKNKTVTSGYKKTTLNNPFLNTTHPIHPKQNNTPCLQTLYSIDEDAN